MRKLREAGFSEEFGEINRSIRVAVEQMESAVSAKDFEKAQFYREQEVTARENLQFVREKFEVKNSGREGPVGKQDIDEVVSKWTGVPLASINQDEGDKLLRMEEELHKRVISQEKAISAVSRAIRRSRAGLKNPARPVGSFVFLGPTGVGKTELARALANFLFGSDHALIRFDMSEYMEKHSVSKLIGSPPGYVGHEEGGQLTEKVKRNPYSVVLLDEIEKAHPDLFNILLQVFEDGHLTDGLGNRVNFKNTIIIMTSNIGARFIQKKAALGFQSADQSEITRTVSDMVLGEVKRTFNPEFINRIDEIIVFEALSDDDLRTHPGSAGRSAEREPRRSSAADCHHAGSGRLDYRGHVQGQVVWRTPPAPRDPALHRGSALGGTDPRASARWRDRGLSRCGRPGLSTRRPGRGRPSAGLKRPTSCRLNGLDPAALRGAGEPARVRARTGQDPLTNAQIVHSGARPVGRRLLRGCAGAGRAAAPAQQPATPAQQPASPAPQTPPSPRRLKPRLHRPAAQAHT